MAKRTRKTRLTTTNISMPSNLRAEVDEQVRERGFGNVSEYFRDLVRRDVEQVEESRRRLRKMLEEGERSGPPVEADEAFWARLRAMARSGAGRSRRKAG